MIYRSLEAHRPGGSAVARTVTDAVRDKVAALVATAPAPIENAGPSPAQPTPPGDAASEPARAAVEAAAPRDEERAAPVVAIPLELTFDRESWVEVTDSRGERLLFGLTAAGREVTVRGEPPFAVVLGDADAVRLSVAGEPYAIPTTGRQGNLARFSVDIAEE
jgi:cytoskeleton protein RodZ